MQGQNIDIQESSSEEPSFLEREAEIAASLGDHAGVTARPVCFWTRVHYLSVGSNQTEKSAATKKMPEPVSPWRESAIHRQQLLGARLA